MSNTAVFGLYDTQFDVEIAIQRLTDTGFRSADISVLLPKNAGSKDLAIERNSKAPEGTAAGGASGAAS